MPPTTRIYPVFLSHAGCPFRCVYCNQYVVTDLRPRHTNSFRKGPAGTLISHFHEQLSSLIQEAQRSSLPGEIAFYGGTFTALPTEPLTELLSTAGEWVEKGLFTGIRFSTRPDCLTPSIEALLVKYPVLTVELGVQSLCDEVLVASGRGYDSQTVRHAVGIVHKHGWGLGIQLMPGLPGDTPSRFMESVEGTLALGPNFVRLYPTIVLTGTLLAEWFRQGSYTPLSMEDALQWCSSAYDACVQAGVPVVRMGLHADPELEKPGVIAAGPYHPAFGYLVRVRRWRNRVDECLQNGSRSPKSPRLVLRVAEHLLSEFLGPGRSNITHWTEKWQLEKIRVEGSAPRSSQHFELIWE